MAWAKPGLVAVGGLVASGKSTVARRLASEIGAERIEAVNSTTNRANVGHELALRKAFGPERGCVYRIVGDRVHATLYSVGDVDVAAVASSLGGGGHKNAAGFSVPLERWLHEFL